MKTLIERIKRLLRAEWATLFIGAMLSIAVTWNAVDGTIPQTIHSKADQAFHIHAAYYLFHDFTHAEKADDNGRARPSAYREPLYSVYLALVIALNPTLHAMDKETLRDKDGGARVFQRSLIVVLLLTASLACYLAVLLTGNKMLGWVVFVMVGFSHAMHYLVTTLKVELFAAMWLTLVTVLFVKTYQTRKRGYFIASGVALGLLILDKAVFMYLPWLLLLAALVWMISCRRRMTPALLKNLGIFFCSTGIVVAFWLARNSYHFDAFFITYRSGVVLSIRSEYDRMTDVEYDASFLYWMPSERAKATLRREFGAGYDLKNGPLVRLNSANREGIYNAGRRRQRKVFKKAEGTAIQKEQQLKALAISRILERPWSHLKATLPVGWRSMFVEQGYQFWRPFILEIKGPVAISIAYYLALLVVLLCAIGLRKWNVLLMVTPSLYLFLINAMFTHGIPRYNQPAIPLLAVMVVLAPGLVSALTIRWDDRLRRRRSFILRRRQVSLSPESGRQRFSLHARIDFSKQAGFRFVCVTQRDNLLQ